MIMSAHVASPIDLNEFARRAALKMEEHDFHGFEPVVLAVVEEMLTVGDGQKAEDERAAFEADFICRWKAQNPKAFEGAVDVQASVFEMLLKRRADGEYENLVPREAWFSWQSSANRLAKTEPEAPLVVAWLSWVPGYDGNNDSRQTHFTEKQARSRIEFISPFLDGVDEARADALMTVAQHERIVAALSARPEQPLRMPTDELQAFLAEAEGVRDLSDVAHGWQEATECIARLNANRPAQPAPKPSDDSLIQNAKALLALDARKALEPHGIGGLAREVIESLIARLESGACIAHAGSVRYGRYETKPAESLAGIALRQLHDESRWVEIRDLNAHAFHDMGPHDYYPVGTVLTMPAVPAAQAEQLIPWIADAPSRSEAAIVAIRDLWDEDECPSYPVVAHALRELLTTTPIDQPERK